MALNAIGRQEVPRGNIIPTKGRSYHHGNLREALLDAVVAMAGETGIEGLSIREAARRVGVSHPAAFRHFADKRALLTAFATLAAGHLAEALEVETKDRETPDGFLRVGVAYLRFAMDHPAEFRIIFREELLDGSDAEYRAQMDRLAATLSGAGQTIEEGGPLPPEALLAWAATHGLACLYLDGSLSHDLPEGQELAAMTDILKGLDRR